MAWEHTFVTLACGCAGTGVWDQDWPGDEQKCSAHGTTTIERIARVSEPRTTKYQLGTDQGGE